ncbi:MAG: cytoplasmic protein [Proteobacteria bacterium]|nr:cytoplasmic protein [Pseudomonadota bacterium]
MKWSTPADLRQQVQRWWDRGDILTAQLPLEAGVETTFPRRLTLKTPSANQLRDHFAAAREWSQQLRAMPHLRLEMRDFRHQVFGQNSLPAAVWLDDALSAVALLGKQKEARLFAQISTSTAVRHPKLLAWLAKRPLRALELAEDWPRLLDVVDWLLAHPRPGIYLRQMDIPGVHSKFVEAQRGVLGELLDRLLPEDCIDTSASGLSQFNRRYGFLDKPERIRLRWLDPARSPFPGLAQADLTLDAASFARLGQTTEHVFITENETNFLAFPAIPNALLIFGAGYGFAALSGTAWLHDCRIHYWGDIDTHGFAILDELRSHFPHVESLLMDRSSFLAHSELWGDEPLPQQRQLRHLTPDEQALYDDLRDNRLGKNLRLEQERIAFGQLQAALARI